MGREQQGWLPWDERAKRLVFVLVLFGMMCTVTSGYILLRHDSTCGGTAMSDGQRCVSIADRSRSGHHEEIATQPPPTATTLALPPTGLAAVGPGDRYVGTPVTVTVAAPDIGGRTPAEQLAHNRRWAGLAFGVGVIVLLGAGGIYRARVHDGP